MNDDRLVEHIKSLFPKAETKAILELSSTLFRPSDPATSEAAAKSIAGKTSNLERLIVETIISEGPMTTGEIQQVLEQSKKIRGGTRVNKRMALLRRSGQIWSVGERRDPVSGRAQTLYSSS